MTGPQFPPAQQLIGGQWSAARHKDGMPVVDPATHEVISTVAPAGAEDIDFGRLACIRTNDVSRALRPAKDVGSGQVAVNRFHDDGVLGSPFTMQKALTMQKAFIVQKDSGCNGGAGYGALREYTRDKAVALRLLGA